MDELFQGFARIGCFHEGFADEETAEAGGTQAADGFGVGDAAFGNKERGCRSVGGFAQLPGYPEGVFYIGDEGAYQTGASELAQYSSNSIRKGDMIRLREILLNYELPKKWLHNSPVK